DHAHEAALLIGGLEHDHGEADISAILGGDALDQRALLALGAGWRVAADLPVVVNRLDRALRAGALGRASRDCQHYRGCREQRSHCAKKHSWAEGTHNLRLESCM